MRDSILAIETAQFFSPATIVRWLLFIPLALLGLFFATLFLKSLLRLKTRQNSDSSFRQPSAAEYSTGFVTTFFDTLGIGAFAPTTAIFRAFRLVPDEIIPGTLNVGHTLSAVIGAFIFIELVPVSASTLMPMLGAAMLGAWFGAGIVSRLPRRSIRLGMGGALLAAAVLMLLALTGYLPVGGDALELGGVKLIAAVIGNFIFGSLMTLGIGLYAPCMILVTLLGMNPLAAFPIMMGSCAYLMPVCSARFLRTERYSASAALGLTLGGIPALLIAAFVVKSLPLTTVRWVVVVVVIYTGTMLLRAAVTERVLRNSPEEKFV